MFRPLSALLLVAAAAPASAEVRDRFARTYPLAAGAAISVEITAGTVQVRAWDRPAASVEIVRRAPDAAGLAAIPVDVTTTAEGLAIRAVQRDEGRDAALRTDVVVQVPAAALVRDVRVFEGRLEIAGLRGSISARVERGDIAGTELAGAIRLETAMGAIALDNAALSPGGVIRLRTFNGDVTVGLAAPPEHARILSLSMGGTITSDIPLTLRDRWGPRFGEATLGSGEPVLSIDVVNGNVTIRVPGRAR